MTPSPPPPDHPDLRADLIDAGAGLALALIRHLSALLAGGERFAPGALRWMIRHYLVPAEALLRRAIHLLAETLPLPEAPRPRAGSQAASPAPSARPPGAPRPPAFRLSEAAPRPRTDYLPVNQRPMISIPGITPRPPARLPVSAETLEAGLRRRLAAFEAAAAQPVRTARRLLRRRARPALKAPVLILENTPGRAAKSLSEEARDLFDAMNAALAPNSS